MAGKLISLAGWVVYLVGMMRLLTLRDVSNSLLFFVAIVLAVCFLVFLAVVSASGKDRTSG